MFLDVFLIALSNAVCLVYNNKKHVEKSPKYHPKNDQNFDIFQFFKKISASFFFKTKIFHGYLSLYDS